LDCPYGPAALLKASVVRVSWVLTLVHEHSAQVNVVCARLPVHVIMLAMVTLMGGPPPVAHTAGAGPSFTAGTQLP
jgi:hypothetical protein